jgi:sugar phosphate isomerase/epimerase
MLKKLSRRTFSSSMIAAVSSGVFGARLTHARPPVAWEKQQRDLKPGKTPVRLACFDLMLNRTGKVSITETVKHVRDAGYTAALTHTGLGRRNAWLNAPEGEITELKTALKEYDIALFDAMIWANLIHPDEAVRREHLKYAAENIEAADRIGCPMVTAVTGSCDPKSYIGIHPDNWAPEVWKLTVRVVRQLLKDTSGCKTALGVEACITTNIDGPAAHKKLMDDVGDPRCKVCLDPTNMMSFERYYHSTELLNECFDLLGESILGCHAKDTLIPNDKMLAYITEAPPGQGVQDYETYLVRLSRMKWPRTLLLEHFPAKEYPPAKRFIEDTAARIGVMIYK